MKSTDRREMFEEAAGISRFRHRKEEAERKLERTDENLLRINDKIDELELQVEPLREQSERAKRFLILRDELKGLEISVWLDTLERLRAGSIKLETDYKEAVRQRRPQSGRWRNALVRRRPYLPKCGKKRWRPTGCALPFRVGRPRSGSWSPPLRC